jgi:His/Glu/Gln/Arg/opine family amino acid ABC transporter permease subunit
MSQSSAALVRIGPRLSWSGARARAIGWQLAVVAVAVAMAATVAVQTTINLRARGIASGFDFLSRPAGFEIARGLLSFSSRESYAHALLVGLLNTVRVSFLGIAIASVLGLSIGIARLSGVWIVSTAARAYVEVVRNTPLLLELLFWYTLTHFIALFKDTSLVIVIGLFDLLGAAKAVLVDPKWVGFGVEVYLFTAAVYFLFCFAVSRFSLRLERELQRARAA